MKKTIILFCTMYMMLCQPSHSKEGGAETPLQDIIKNPASYAGKIVSVQGFLKYNLAGVPYLFLDKNDAAAANYKNGFDLAIPYSLYLPDENMVKKGRCASVIAKFFSYDEKIVRLDYIASPTGKLIVSHIKIIKCP